ncbi:MAG: hypothetical protein AB7I09_15760 [Planctomycetota bacterium]
MRSIGRRLALIWIVAGLPGIASAAPAPQTVPASDLISMEFDGIELRQCVQFIIRNRRINLVTAETLDQKVTVKLNDIPWRSALESVLKAHGFTFVEEEGVLLVSSLDSLVANQRLVPILVRLQHITAEAARSLLEPLLSAQGKLVILGGQESKVFSVIDNARTLEMVQNLVPKFDLPSANATGSMTVREDGMIDLALANFPLSDIARLLESELGLNVAVQGALTGSIDINLTGVRWEDALQLMLARHQYAFRKERDVVVIGKAEDLKDAFVTREFRLRYADGWDLKPYLEKLLSPEGKLSCYAPAPRSGFEFGTKVSERRSKRVEDQGTGRARVLTVTDRSVYVESIAERIHTLDVKPQQVEVDVKIIEIRHGRSDSRGFDWNTVLAISGANRPTTLPWGDTGGKLFPTDFPDPATGFTFGSLTASQFTAVLRLIRESTDAEVVSEPNITTLDNIEASILIGQKFPVTSETIDPQTAVRTVTLDYYEDIGIQLLVVPSVTEDQRIQLVIHPAVSTVAGLIEDRFPIIDTREADTQVLLPSGDTAVIGGLVSRDTDELERSVPWLSRIPFLGYFFRYREEVESSTELVIFVTPRLVKDATQLADSVLVSPSRKQALRELKAVFERATAR